MPFTIFLYKSESVSIQLNRYLESLRNPASELHKAVEEI